MLERTIFDRTNFYEVISDFETLPGTIDEVTVDASQVVLDSPEAFERNGIVYVFSSAQPIPGLMEGSRVIYQAGESEFWKSDTCRTRSFIPLRKRIN